MRDLRVDDQRSALLDVSCETMERVPDVIQVFEEVQMVGIDIEDQAVPGLQAEETVGVFTGFRNKVLRTSDTDIAADLFQDTAHGDRGIQIRLQKDAGQHGGRSGLAVGACDSNGILVVGHDLAQKLGAGEHGNAHLDGPDIFRVVMMDRCRIDHDIRVRGNILRLLREGDPGSLGDEQIRERRLLHVRTRDGETFF